MAKPVGYLSSARQGFSDQVRRDVIKYVGFLAVFCCTTLSGDEQGIIANISFPSNGGLACAKPCLRVPKEGSHSIGAFNEGNLEWTAAILDAAEGFSLTVIIQCGTAKWQVSYRVVADMVVPGDHYSSCSPP